MVPSWVSEPIGNAWLLRTSKHPAMKVVATAPRPGKKTASLPWGRFRFFGCCMVGDRPVQWRAILPAGALQWPGQPPRTILVAPAQKKEAEPSRLTAQDVASSTHCASALWSNRHATLPLERRCPLPAVHQAPKVSSSAGGCCGTRFRLESAFKKSDASGKPSLLP